MPPRRGGFAGGLNPFGGGTLGSLAQYDIGADLADLAVYTTEVAWGNGMATDADYLAALRRAVDATDPDTQRQASAQNKLDDAIYRVGRSQADAAGLDALIAYDQAALATMSPDNLRYRDVLDSLEAEMAQRRSRDYGLLVTSYNDGDLPTATLLAWVDQTLATISPDDPDFNNWTSVKGDLTDRLEGERDTAVFQDYQRGRIAAPEYLAFLTARRDSYAPNTPKYQEWANRLEDATVQVKEEAQAKKDSDVFNRYEEGLVSDQTYLRYLRTRIDGMAPDDPQRAEWQHRLTQGTFSLAEDKLRFDAQRAADKVNAAKSPKAADIRAANAAGQKLLDFYQSYRTSLNPGSAEWRDVTRSIDELARNLATPAPARPSSGGGGGGGGSTSGGGGAGATAPGAAVGAGPTSSGKTISPKYSLSNILGLFSINPTANKKAVSAATKYLALNVAALDNALNRGDGYWLFQDPRKPGATVAARDPNGDLILDKNGKPVMVRGSAYLKTSSEAYSNLKTVEASNFMAAGELALAKGKYGDYAYNLRRASETLDQARLQDAQYRAQNWEDWYKATEVAVDKLTMAGDYAGAMRVATDLAGRLARESQNPYLDDTRRARLDEIGQKLADNKIMPKSDEQGNVLYEGAVNLAELSRGNLMLNPGWHHVLKSNDRGRPEWGPVFDAKQDGTWEQKHVTVHTTLGDRLVTGEAVKSTSPLNPTVLVRTPDGYKTIVATGSAEMLSFVDERGLVQRAYSIDGGRTWIRPAAGMPAPTIELNTKLKATTDAQGVIQYLDETTGEVVLSQNSAGGWDYSTPYLKAHPELRTWYGQSAWEAARATPAGKQQLRSDDPREARLPNIVDAARMDMGGLGQHMTLAFASPSGIVNLVPSNFATEAQLAARKAKAAGSKGYTPRESEMAVLRGEQASRRSLAANDWQAPTPRESEMAVLRGEQASRRALLAGRPVTAGDIAAQLPADTPPRYDGYTVHPPPTVVAKAGPSKSLPALVPPTYSASKLAILKGPAPAPLPALKAKAPPTVAAKSTPVPAIKKSPAPPPTVAAKKGTTPKKVAAPAPKPPTYSASKTAKLQNL